MYRDGTEKLHESMRSLLSDGKGCIITDVNLIVMLEEIGEWKERRGGEEERNLDQSEEIQRAWREKKHGNGDFQRHAGGERK